MPRNQGWTREQNLLALWAYGQVEKNEPTLNKAQLFRNVGAIIDRKPGAVEKKVQNFAACLPPGTKPPVAPLKNMQTGLPQLFNEYWPNRMSDLEASYPQLVAAVSTYNETPSDPGPKPRNSRRRVAKAVKAKEPLSRWSTRESDFKALLRKSIAEKSSGFKMSDAFSTRTSARVLQDALLIGIYNLNRLDEQISHLVLLTMLRTIHGDELLLAFSIGEGLGQVRSHLREMARLGQDNEEADKNRDDESTLTYSKKNNYVAVYLTPDGQIYMHNNGAFAHAIGAHLSQLGPSIALDELFAGLYPQDGQRYPTKSALATVEKLTSWAGDAKVTHLTSLMPIQTAVSVTATITFDNVAIGYQKALHDTGLIIPGSLSRSFLTALATKRFAILTGLSGSGKTQIALRLGEWFGKEGDDDRYKVVPVRPDWTSPEYLLGYQDNLTPADEGRRAHHAPDVLKFILKAHKDPTHPYLLVLDEMNLAHVERYFADILSGLESEQEVVPHVEQGKDGLYWPIGDEEDPKIRLPKNLFIVGTVNVDETTYMFSPKVLDRANTFEFRVSHKALDPNLERPKPCDPGPEALVQSFLAIAQDDSFHKKHPADYQKEFADKLTELHKLLAAGDWEFGHRVFYESNRFAALLGAAGDTEMEDALDAQLMQKILPRLHGNRRKLEATLCALGIFCHDLSYDGKASDADRIKRYKEVEDPLEKLTEEQKAEAVKLPVSHNKINRMLKNLRANQFASFTE